ncbi:hypothetical protein K435DRAFT_29228 [Dendrothele bispora CBS 962.96]|uniref:Uncharacterized protein n=1 Tax=Dendrothele bispora (strain CBS 962.96) TaxID=1314807 RepID=A0A4S8M834_DENBC|nr:hypothetical protein K435DRAFT_29228 [Dendrothele bispora CBS 962.96]
MGSDPILPTTEIISIPCAGVRIPYGKLSGLMAWRFVVELDTDPSNSKQKRSSRQSQSQSQLPKGLPRPGVVSNFILDTGSSSSHVSQETLKALGYKGIYKAGTEVHLRIQGVSTKCLIARYGEAGRLGGQFMTAGSLTFYFDTKLNAPVLYAGDTNERPTDIPRTVTLDPNRKARRNSLRDSVYAIMTSLHLIRAGESSA